MQNLADQAKQAPIPRATQQPLPTTPVSASKVIRNTLVPAPSSPARAKHSN